MSSIVLTLAPVDRTRAQAPAEPVLRSISKAVSLSDMSHQERSIALHERVAAARLIGAAGPDPDVGGGALPASATPRRTASTHAGDAPPWAADRRKLGPSV